MPGCAVYGCGNSNVKTKGTSIKYFTFPKSEICKQWVVLCKRADTINLKNACICSIHFHPSCFQVSLKHKLLNYNPKNCRNLKHDAIPTLNLPGSDGLVLDRANRLQETSAVIKTLFIQDYIIPNEKVVPDNNNTEEDVSIKTQNDELERELRELREKVKKLEITNSDLSHQLKLQSDKQKRGVEGILGKVFTTGQIKKLLNPEKKIIKWSSDDISNAISLRSVSPKAYRYLRAHNFPFPGLSTLRTWAATFDLSEGILGSVISLMKNKSVEFTLNERLCILSFDEMYLSNRIDIEKKEERKVGPHKSCQVVMARGLMANWKQPVFYNFDQPMTPLILNDIISLLYKAGYPVVGMVSDMGTGNVGLWKKLKVGHDKNCFFSHPEDDSSKIFVFADAPHLLKLVRNHLLDHGFYIDGVLIDKSCFEHLLSISTTDLTYAHKLTKYNLNVKGSERQRVGLAAKVLSHSVAQAIKYCGKEGLMPENSNWAKVAETTQVFNDWFDLNNSRSKFTEYCPLKHAFGADFNIQKEFLDKVSKLILSMRVVKHKGLIPFQKGILLSNRSLVEMYEYLRVKFNFEYVLTSRLNQDILENFFSYVRGMGGSNDHPSPLQFRYRLRWYILGKHSAAIFTQNKNTVETCEPCLLQPLEIPECLTVSALSPLTTNLDEDVLIAHDFEDFNPLNGEFIEPQYSELDHDGTEGLTFSEDKISRECLRYIAGYVAFRFKDKYNLGIPTKTIINKEVPEWLQFISRGNLLHPNDDLYEAALILNKEFQLIHGNTLSEGKFLFKKLAQQTIDKLKNINITLPFEVILCLSRTRTYIRLRDLNRKISFENCRRKLNSKMSKITNQKL